MSRIALKPGSLQTTTNYHSRRITGYKQKRCVIIANSQSCQRHSHKLVGQFNPQIPMEKALTPPSSWYIDPSFFDLELHRVFYEAGYHLGWTYGLDGALFKATRVTGIHNFDTNVFCDNYLDGGYHVPYAHKDLASGLKLNSYATTIREKVSIQSYEGSSIESEDNLDRLGSNALYAFVYRNFMINRYGPWMDTNLVLLRGPNK